MPFSIRLVLSTVALATACTASVVILPGGQPKPYNGPGPVYTANELFRKSLANEFFNTSAQVLFSSYDHDADNVDPHKSLSLQDDVRASGDSFVRGAIQAWGEHLHLVVRPDEVWFTILVQMNFYMQSHADDVRHLFVDYEGRETVTVEDATWWNVLLRFQDEIQARVKTDWLRDWIVPGFTTTTDDDVMTANVLMMGLTKAYFDFEGGIICGLPSVTLLGVKADWQALLDKLGRLPEFGAEPAAYADRLKPVLTRFVRSFDEPNSRKIRDFWNSIVSARAEASCGAPPFYMSGWIAGFLYWDDQGKPYARNTRDQDLQLDGIRYPYVDITSLPVGYASAPFTMLDYGGVERFEAYVAAGTLGKRITRGPPAGYADALQRTRRNASTAVEGQNTLQPLSAWVVYGPKSHDATRDKWRDEIDLLLLTESLERNFDENTCGSLGSDRGSESNASYMGTSRRRL